MRRQLIKKKQAKQTHQKKQEPNDREKAQEKEKKDSDKENEREKEKQNHNNKSLIIDWGMLNDGLNIEHCPRPCAMTQ